MFYFQQLLNTALAGIDGTAIVPTVTSFAFAILLIGFLISLYQAAFRGGDLQALAVTAVKYLVVAMIVASDAWPRGDAGRWGSRSHHRAPGLRSADRENILFYLMTSARRLW